MSLRKTINDDEQHARTVPVGDPAVESAVAVRDDSPQSLPTGACATLACLLEVCAAKPGNVYRGADFEDLTFADFLVSAVVIGPAMENASSQSVGRTVLAAVQATRAAVRTNTNLGTVLLLAPLAAVPRESSIASGLPAVLGSLDEDDARRVYDAIRLAAPGGLGSVSQADVAGLPSVSLIAAMQLAADRDLVARQYTNGFADVRERLVPWISEGLSNGWPLAEVIVWTHLQQMSASADSLIARKCGHQLAAESAARAGAVLESGVPGDEAYHRAVADLDFWLRQDGHRRNPGTTADLIAASLFVALREGVVRAPLHFYDALEDRFEK